MKSHRVVSEFRFGVFVGAAVCFSTTGRDPGPPQNFVDA